MSELFWSKVKKTDNCWLWTAALYKNGYGQYKGAGGKWSAHRYSYFLAHPTFDQSLFVLHKCDVRNCVNPNHLFLGSQKDNIQDMVRKNRHYSPSKGITHCVRGHEFNEENTKLMKAGRVCKTCRNQNSKDRLQKLKLNPEKYQKHLKKMRARVKIQSKMQRLHKKLMKNESLSELHLFRLDLTVK